MTKLANYLITGATSGIGLACTEYLAEKGNTLVIVGRNVEKMEEIKKNFPEQIFYVNYDLSDSNNVKTIFDVCETNSIKLDGMVYSAGMDELCPIKAFNVGMAQKIMAVNCFSFVAMCRYFYSKRLSMDGSSIVAISSLGSVLNEKGMVSYSMSKAALNSAIKTISKEFVKRRIKVNAILPGGVNSKMGAEKTVILQEIGAQPATDNPQPLGGIRPESIVKMICFLLDKDNDFCTGELLSISGGREYNL